MKKNIIIMLGLVLVIAMAFGLVACDNGQGEYIPPQNRPIDIDVRGFDFDIHKAEIIKVGDYTYAVSEGNALVLKYYGDEQRIVVPEQVTKNDTTYAVKGIASEAYEDLDSSCQLVIPDYIVFADENIIENCCTADIFVEWSDGIPSFWAANWAGWNKNVHTNFEAFGSNDDYDYIIYKDNTIELYEYKGTQKDIVIPSYIDDNKVTYFGRIFNFVEDIQSIFIPATIQKINNTLIYTDNYDIKIYVEATKESTITWYQDWNEYSYYEDGHYYDKLYTTYYNCKGLGTNDDYDYIIHNDDTLTLTNYKGSDTQITIPEKMDGYTVAEIGSIFAQNTELTTIELPATIKNLPEKAFGMAENLTIYSHSSKQPLDWHAYWNIYGNWDRHNVIWDVKKLGSDENFDYVIKNDDTVHILDLNTATTELYIPDEIEGKPVKYINSDLINGNYDLKKVSLPKSLMYDNFLQKYTSNLYFGTYKLVEVEYRGTLTDWLSMESYPEFNPRISLTVDGVLLQGEVVIPQEIKTLRNYAFANIRNITSVILHEGITSIGEQAFEYCIDLQSMVLPDSITQIGECAFYFTSNMTEIVLSQNLTTIPKYAFADSGILDIQIPGSVKSIQDYAFNSSDLQSITLNEGLVEIGKSAFWNCDNIIEINLPSTLTSIDRYAFDSCENLSDIYLSNSIIYMGDNVFNQDYNAKIFCEAQSKPSGWSENWDILENVEGEDTKRHNVFWGVNTTSQNESYEYIVQNNQVYLLKYIADETEVVVPDEIDGMPVVCIGQAFKDNASLTSITLGDNITYIYQGAFANCKALTQVTLSDNVKEIRQEAFSHCTQLSQFTMPTNLEKIEDKAFYWCLKLQNVVTNQNLKEMGEEVFTYTNLSRLDLPKSITKLKGIFNRDAFAFSQELDVYYAGSLQDWLNIEISDICFNRAISLYIQGNKIEGQLVLPEGITKISDYAFAGINITSVIIPEGVLEMGEGTFKSCIYLENVEFADSVERIDEYAFAYCIALKDFELPQNLKEIEFRAFYSCNALTKVEIPYSVTNLCSRAFEGCENLTEVYIPDSEISIGSFVFDYCDNLIIYCEKNEEPDNWSSSFWNYNSNFETYIIPVVWGYKPTNLDN